MNDSEVRVLAEGSIHVTLRLSAEDWENISGHLNDALSKGKVSTGRDGDTEVEMTLTPEEWKSLEVSLPPEPEEGDATPMGFWPKAHWYCVKVWTRQGGRRFLCQKSVYESPLWAWARAAGIGLRKAGKDAEVNMSKGRCQGEQNSCGV